MATYALEASAYPGVNTPYKKGCLLPLVVTFVDGVPSVAAARSGPGFTVAGDTGVYTGTAPLAARGVALAQVVTPTADLVVTIASYVPTTGVFAFNAFTANTGAAIDVPTGSEIHILFFLEGG